MHGPPKCRPFFPPCSLIWTDALHRRFLEALETIGGVDKAPPKAIMKVRRCMLLWALHAGLGGLCGGISCGPDLAAVGLRCAVAILAPITSTLPIGQRRRWA